MTPGELLSGFVGRGFVLRQIDGSLGVSPASALTATDRAVLREHRDELVASLTEEEPWNSREAIQLIEGMDPLVQRLGVNGTNPAILAAVAMVTSAYATQDMETVRFACAEFTATVRCVFARKNLTAAHG